MKIRCDWVKDDFDKNYHDNEWCKIEKSEQKLFELLILEGMQAGLSWNIILKRREKFLENFNNFDYNICSKYTNDELEEKLQNKDIIRHRLKIYSVRTNAIAFIEIQKEYGTFYNYIWSFVNFKQINNKHEKISDIPSKTELSDTISKDMKKRGFKFVGSTIIYSYLQAIGIINDHIITCFCYKNCLQN